jgi:hypothetical protein
LCAIGLRTPTGMDSRDELLRRVAARMERYFATPGDAEVDETEVVVSQLVTVAVQDTQRRTVTRTMRRTDELQGLMVHFYDVVAPGGGAARGE